MTAIPPQKRDADRVYRQYVKPIESQHLGEFVTVSREGQMVFASSLVDAMLQGTQRFGKGNFVFKVGEKVVGTIL